MIKGQAYCGSCKTMAVPEGFGEGTIPCAAANTALKWAILSLFCFGIITGPIAVSKGMAAKKAIAMDPALSGSGKATAAIVIGAITPILWLLGVVTRASGN